MKHLLSAAQAVALATTIFLAPSAWPDTSAAKNPETKKTCYCGCDSAPGSTMCQHMCDLAKYKDRSWASNCQKKPVGEAAAQNPASHTPAAKKSNREQQARMN